MDTRSTDWNEFLSLLISHRVKFLVIGGHAIAFHARARVTEDLDVFVEASSTNAKRIRRVLEDFGFRRGVPSLEELATVGKVFMIGLPPRRIDVLTKISGVRFATAYAERVNVRLAGLTIPVISFRALLRNKRAAGRDKDLLDVQMLLEARARARGPKSTPGRRSARKPR